VSLSLESIISNVAKVEHTDGVLINDLLCFDFGGRHDGWIEGGGIEESA